MTEPTRDALTPTNPTPTGALAEAAQTSVESPAALPWLGHVTALRSWKQGGLGEVLVGRDEQLHRDVAFKRIRAQRVDDPESRRRFELEAEITAKLEHPGIVPIYGLVQGADGRPCYVMRFIHGETLKAAIQKWHAGDEQPKDEPPGSSRRSGRGDGGDKPRRSLDFGGLAFRALLQKFIAVCETMAFAHSKGILHRDLKPDNVMLGKYGETLVVDWGLAKPFGQTEVERSAGEASLTLPSPSGRGAGGEGTQMGQTVGTPAYMSPEQATGRWNIVGPASDIYSLGALLYEMLTGQRPVQGQDAFETIAKVQRGEFPHPRQWRSDVPRPLEAICLKAMAVKPDERYATAKELAGDVEQWLADDAVSAYGEPWPARAGRWMRRHRALVSSGVVALALGVAAMTGFTMLVQQHADVVEEQRNELAERNAALQAANQALNAAHAHERLLNERARQAIETVTSDTAIEQLTREKELRLEQKDFLDQMIRYYAECTQEAAATEAERSRQARAYLQMGRMNQILGRTQDSETAYREAAALGQQLASDFPSQAKFRQDLAMSHNNLAILFRDTGRLEEAESAFANALAIRKQLAADFHSRTKLRQDLAMSHNNLGEFLCKMGRLKEAEAAYADGLAIQKQLAADFPARTEFRQDLATSQNNLGALLQNTGRVKEAESAYAAALAIRKQLAGDFPNRPEVREDLAVTHSNLGALLQTNGRLKEAEPAYTEALAIRKQLAADFPTQPEFRRQLANSHNNLGLLLYSTGRLKDAEPAFGDALAIRKRLAADFPTRSEFRQELAGSHNNLGLLFRATGRLPEAESAYTDALTLFEQLAAESPIVPEYRNDAAGTLVNLATLAFQRGDSAAACQRLDEALPHHQAALQVNPRDPTYRQYYRNNLWVLTWSCARQGDRAAALAAAMKRRDLGWNPAADAYDAACALARCVRIVEKNDNLLTAKPHAEMEFYADEAMKLLRDAVAKGYKDLDHLKKDDDLKALRQREDFKKLVKEMETGTGD